MYQLLALAFPAIGGVLLIVLYCVVILIIAKVAISLSEKLVDRILNSKFGHSSVFDEKKAKTLGSIFKSVLRYVIYFIAGCSILTNLGVDIASIIAVAGIGSVAIGFGAQSLVSDVIAGFFILLEDQYAVGDIISSGANAGVVEKITLRSTQLRSPDGTLIIIPNGQIGVVQNKCKEYINAIVDVGIAYEEDMTKVLKVLNDEMDSAATKLKGLKSRPTVLGIIALDDSAVTVRIVAECEVKENLGIERELRLMIKNRLDKENITIPFPQCTVHMAKDE